MTFEPKQFGRFYLLERLAMGGMAEIYKAKTFGAEGFEKLLAIKRILPHCAADQDFIRMLIDEAKLSVLLSHANIVQVYDLGKVGDDFFISMEFINGVNMRELLYRLRDSNRPLPIDLTVFILSEVCKGLDYAHRKTDPSGNPLQIVHRDVSPQNILLSYEGEVKLVDFGIAKAAMNMSHTMAGILKGKISYMSPEQALGKQITHHTDIFSVGLILYECLTGQKMFSGESQFEVLKKIRTTKITAAKLPETLPAPLRDIIAKALAYFPKDRYAAAGDMQSELTRYLYSTFHDFTPQRLAAFVRENFAEELSKQLQRAHAQFHRDQNTGSIAAAEVGPTDATDPRRTVPTDNSQPSVPMPPERSLDQFEVPAPHGARRFIAVMIVVLLLALGGLGYLYVRFPTWFRPTPPPTAAELGSLMLTSTPPGAAITVDGTAMEPVTPATIAQLQLGTEHHITLALPGYRTATEVVQLTSDTPTSLHVTLMVATGTLLVNSQPPGAAVQINGQPQAGVTPLTIPALPLNMPVVVHIESPGYQAYDETVRLPSTDLHTVAATLTPIPAPPQTQPIEAIAVPEHITTPPQAPPTQTVPDTKPVTPPAETKTPEIATGAVRVTSTPSGAAILLNGRATGKTTPAVLGSLTAGRTYTIAVRKTGYQGWTRSVRIVADKEVTLAQDLTETAAKDTTKPVKPPKPEPAEITTQTTETVSKHGGAAIEKTTTTTTPVAPAGYGSITISSKPRGANVYVDGRMLGRAPLTIQGVSVSKPHSVRLELPGYAPWSTSIKVEIGSDTMVSAPLQKLGE